ncbi:MAG: Pvc16 family protein, partial [Chloroflexota bacterium]
SLRSLLIRDLPISNGDIDIKFDQPTRDWSARLTKPTINLFLYNVRENATLRQHHWQAAGMGGNGNGHPHLATKKRMPFRVDCTYMLSVWAAHPEDEHTLLTRAMLALFRHPILPEEVLEPGLRNQPVDIRAELASEDKLSNPAEIWGSLNNDIKPIVPYVLTLALDPWDEVSGPIVQQFEIRAGQARLPERRGIVENGIAFSTFYVGGMVHTKDGEPQQDIQIAIKGSGWMAKTNRYGRYTLGGLPAGEHTLIVWPASGKGKPQERKITLTSPSPNGQPPEAGPEFDFII